MAEFLVLVLKALVFASYSAVCAFALLAALYWCAYWAGRGFFRARKEIEHGE